MLFNVAGVVLGILSPVRPVVGLRGYLRYFSERSRHDAKGTRSRDYLPPEMQSTFSVIAYTTGRFQSVPAANGSALLRPPDLY